jgi:hypothetical protein
MAMLEQRKDTICCRQLRGAEEQRRRRGEEERSRGGEEERSRGAGGTVTVECSCRAAEGGHKSVRGKSVRAGMGVIS